MKTFKRLTSFFIALCMIMSFIPNVAITVFADEVVTDPSQYGGGTGTEEDPYIIKNADHMKTLSNMVNKGFDATGKKFKVADSVTEAIVLTTADEFVPIGTETNPFKGTFDGNGKTFNLDIDESDSYAGLFGCISGGTIKNVNTTGTVKDGYYVGGVVGCVNGGTVTDCTNSGAVTGNGTYVGGIVGYIQDGETIINCTNSGAVTGSGNAVGGIVGFVYIGGEVANCTNSGAVTGNEFIGGIVGTSWDEIEVTNCANSGAITGSRCVGGIVGRTRDGTEVTNCANSGAVTGGGNVGGIVGYNSSSRIINTMNTGAVTGNVTTESYYYYIGGIAGYLNRAEAENCVNSGSVTSTDGTKRAGGIAGLNYSSTVSNCYYVSETDKNTDICDFGYNRDKNVDTTKNLAKTQSELLEKNVVDRLNIYVRKNTTDDLALYYWIADTEANTLKFTSTAQETPYTITNNSSCYADVTEYADKNTSVTVKPQKNMKLISVSVVTEDEQTRIYVTDNEDGTFKFEMPKCDVKLTAKGDINFDKDDDGNYIIKSAEDMRILSTFANNVGDTANKTFKVSDDVLEIELTTEGGFEPIGTKDNPFKGTFDGNGKTFKLTIDKSDGDYVGLFGYVESGTIKNVNTSGTVTGKNYVGGIVGYAESDTKNNKIITITNCANSGAVTGDGAYVGGIVGYSESSRIINTMNSGAVTGNDYIGGIAGYFKGAAENCVSSGSLTLTGESSFAGGIAGKYVQSNLTVNKCYYVSDNDKNTDICDFGCDYDGNTVTTKDFAKTQSELLEDDVVEKLNIYAKQNTTDDLALYYWTVDTNGLKFTSTPQKTSYIIINNSSQYADVTEYPEKVKQ